MAHARLAIRDPARGQQPWISEDGAKILVFNGELYNLEEIRSLTSAWGPPRTASDTELAFRLLVDRGSDALGLMEGMFSFAFWDRSRRRCLFGRDRAGEKPLHLAEIDGGGLVFASELRATILGLEQTPPLDPVAVSRFLVLGYVPSPGTIHRGVQQLPPGSWREWRDGELGPLHRYWDVLGLASALEPECASPDRIRAELERSVAARRDPGKPIGVLLSGGMDSTAVTAIAARMDPPPVCISLGFDAPGYDELPAAVAAATELNVAHRCHRLRSDQVEDVACQALHAMDGPLGDPSWIPTFALAGFARKEGKVVLGGDGADEVFAGYQAFAAEALATAVRKTPWLPWRTAAGGIAQWAPKDGYRTLRYAAHQFFQGLDQPPVIRHLSWLGAFESAQVEGLFPDLGVSAEELWSFLEPESVACSAGNLLLANYFRYYLGDCLLIKTDRATMAHGLELRSPFLDRTVVELALSIPYSQKVVRGKTKVVLKRALADVVPRSVLNRQKQGFAPPMSEWLRGPLAEVLDHSLAEITDLWGTAPAGGLHQLVSQHHSGERDHRRKLWSLLALGWWLSRLRSLQQEP